LRVRRDLLFDLSALGLDSFGRGRPEAHAPAAAGLFLPRDGRDALHQAAVARGGGDRVESRSRRAGRLEIHGDLRARQFRLRIAGDRERALEELPVHAELLLEDRRARSRERDARARMQVVHTDLSM
jgi:hypothetical protein